MMYSSRLFYVVVVLVAIGVLFSALIIYIFLSSGEKSVDIATGPVLTDNFNLGQYYFNQDENPDGAYDLTLAYEYYQADIDDERTQNPLSWYQMGRIDFLRGHFFAAIHNFERQLEYFNDEVPNVYYMLGLTYGYKARQTESAEDWELAEVYFKQAVDYFPDQPWPKVDLAWIYFAQGKYEAMLPILEDGLNQHSQNAWLLNMYGLALLNTDQPAEAHEYFLAAKASAEQVTVEEWGRNYPGNNPNSWPIGLREMREAIDHNIAVSNGG